MTARDPVTVVLLGEPAAFSRTRISRAGHLFTPAPQRNAAASLRMAAAEAMTHAGAALFDEPLLVELYAELRIPYSWSKKKRAAAIVGLIQPAKKPDLDNVWKLAADALQGIVYRDDCQVVELHAKKAFGLQPKVVITVRPAVLARPGELPLREAAA